MWFASLGFLLFIEVVVISGGRILIGYSHAIVCFAGASASGMFVVISHASRGLDQDFQVSF